MRMGIYLVEQGAITAEQFVDALRQQQEELPRLGQVAIEEGKVSVRDVFRVLRVQSDLTSDRFGDTAIELGLLTSLDVAELLMIQSNRSRPLTSVLVEQGALSAEAAEQHIEAFRRGMERHGARCMTESHHTVVRKKLKTIPAELAAAP